MDKDQNKIIDDLKKFKHENQISQLFLFGSRAWGRHEVSRDVDLLIISPHFKGLKSFKRSPLLRPKWKMEYSVDMLCLTPEEFEEKKNIPSIVREAVRSGIEIL